MNTTASDIAAQVAPGRRPVGQVTGLLAIVLLLLAVFYALEAWQSEQARARDAANRLAHLAAVSLELSLSVADPQTPAAGPATGPASAEALVARLSARAQQAPSLPYEPGVSVGFVAASGESFPMPGAGGFRDDTRAAAARVLAHVQRNAGQVAADLGPSGWTDLATSVVAYHRIAGAPLTAFAEVAPRHVGAEWFQKVRVPLILAALAAAGLLFASVWSHRQQRAREAENDAAAALMNDYRTGLQRQTRLLEHVQRAGRVAGWEVDTASGALLWTPEAFRIHETTPEAFTPTQEGVLALYAPESRDLLRSAMDVSMRTGQNWDVELELDPALGRRAWIRVTGETQLGQSGLPARMFGSYQDVSERHRSEERMRRLAHYDELTSLPNRSLFLHHLTHAIARAERYRKRIGLLFVDLDRFKVINDSLGHDTGDAVLKVVGQRLSQNMRAADLVARLGGDEFVIVVEEAGTADAIADVARKLQSIIAQPVEVQGQELVLSGSIGISVYPQDGADTQSLLKHADIAMYRAKEQGKNRFEFFSHRMGSAETDRLSLEATLRRAVLEESQFVLHFQPKLSVTEGHITGAEALVRWMSPERGLVSPAEFIPLAEETGLIVALGEWVLRNACEQAAAWARKGLPPIRIAVNLSARQLGVPGFVAMVRTVLTETGVRPGSVELELTESAMMQDLENVAAVLADLKGLGVHLSVDDFGTGYSSLSYLKRLPLDTLKVDRSFVRDVPEDADDSAITRAVVALGHSLRLNVVAEGVETEAQLAFLRELGCDEIQGFIFSKPIVAGEFEDMLRRDLRLAQDARLDAA